MTSSIGVELCQTQTGADELKITDDDMMMMTTTTTMTRNVSERLMWEAA